MAYLLGRFESRPAAQAAYDAAAVRGPLCIPYASDSIPYAYPLCISLMHIPYAYSLCISLMHIPYVYPLCISLMHPLCIARRGGGGCSIVR